MLCVASTEQRLLRGQAPSDPAVLYLREPTLTREDVVKELFKRQSVPARPAADRLTAAVAMRPASAREQRSARPPISPSSKSLGLRSSNSSRVGASTAAAAARQLAMERAARFGARRVCRSTTPSVEDYAQTGLRAYRPPEVVRNTLGWIETSADAESAQTTAEVLVCFPTTGARPQAARGQWDPRLNRLTNQLGATRQPVPAPEAPKDSGGRATPETTRSMRVEIAHEVSLGPSPPTRRRSIGQSGIRDRRSRRKQLSTPRMEPARRLVSDTTVRRLVRRCKAEVAAQKQADDDVIAAQIAAAEQAEADLIAARAAEAEAERRMELERQAEMREQKAQEEKRAELAARNAQIVADEKAWAEKEKQLEAEKMAALEAAARLEEQLAAERAVAKEAELIEQEAAEEAERKQQVERDAMIRAAELAKDGEAAQAKRRAIARQTQDFALDNEARVAAKETARALQPSLPEAEPEAAAATEINEETVEAPAEPNPEPETEPEPEHGLGV